MTTAITCSALLIAWLLLLGFYVSMGRARYAKLSGEMSAPDHPLQKRIRAHGNAAEYIPALCLLFILSVYVAPYRWVEWLIIAATLGRFVQAAGLVVPATMDRANAIRFVGSLSTYVLGIALAAVILLAIVGVLGSAHSIS